MPERQRRDVEQQHVGDPAGQDLGLHRRAERHDFVGIELAMRRLAEELLNALPHERHARRAADQHDLVDLTRGEPRVIERHTAGAERGVHQRARSALPARRG